MTVVSIRCQECDEVKREEKMAGIQVCKECSGGDTPDSPEEDDDANSEDGSVSNGGGVSEEEITEESDSTPTDDADTDETTDSAERDKKPLEESFNEQDPLEW